MSVYFVQCGPDGPIKIGFAEDVARRLVKLQSDNPYPLTLLAEIDGDTATEAELHVRFADLRMRGEWFHPARALRNFVCEIQTMAEPELEPALEPPPVTSGNPLRELRKALGLTQTNIAKLLCLTQSSYCRIEKAPLAHTRTIMAVRSLFRDRPDTAEPAAQAAA